MSNSNFYDLLNWNKYWLENGDPYMKELPLAGSPFYLVFSLVSIFVTVKVIEFLRRNSIPKDIRPLLLIYDGFLFGVFGVGFIIFFVASNFGSFLFSCSKTGSVFPIELSHELVTKHLVYTYISMLVVSLGNQILITFGRSKTRALRVTSSRGTVTLSPYWETAVFGESFITMVHQTIWTIIVTFYLIANPIGETMFEPLVDCINYVCYYGCAILLVTEPVTTTNVSNGKSSKKTSVSPLLPNSLKVKLREMARCVCFLFISAHTFYLQSHEGQCHPPSSSGKVLNYQTTSATVVSIYSAVFVAFNLIRLSTSSHSTPLEGKQNGKVNGKVSGATNPGAKYRRVTRLTAKMTQ